MFRLIRDLRPLLTPEDHRQWLILLTMSLSAGMGRSLFLALINAAIAAGGIGGRLPLYAASVAALIAVIMAADYFAAMRGRWVFARFTNRIRNKLLDQIGSANLQFIERETIGSLHFHLIHTIGVVAGAYNTLLGFVGAAVTLCFNILYIGWLSPLGLAVALVISVVGVATHWHFEHLNLERRKRLNYMANVHNNCHNAYLHGYKELRLSRAKTADYRLQLDKINAELLDEGMAETRISALGMTATNLFQYLAICSVALLLPAIADFQPVRIMQLFSAILFTVGPLGSVVGAFPAFDTALISTNNLKRLVRKIEATRETTGAADRMALPAFENITLRSVRFSFAEERDESDDDTAKKRYEKKLDDEGSDAELDEDFHFGPVDLTINRGEILCVVGGNGSGKTVLMRLISGLYKPEAGEILFNGAAVTDGDRQAYREQMTTVFSDFFLFSELLGRRDTPASTVMKWVDYFGLKGKTAFREKIGAFSTVELSTGQRKRLALIVSILDDRPIIILDEFGAEQDPEHRQLFYRNWLPELKRLGKTVIVVSHDDHYFDAADRVVSMDYGKIVEDRPVAAVSKPAPAPLPERAL